MCSEVESMRVCVYACACVCGSQQNCVLACLRACGVRCAEEQDKEQETERRKLGPQYSEGTIEQGTSGQSPLLPASFRQCRTPAHTAFGALGRERDQRVWCLLRQLPGAARAMARLALCAHARPLMGMPVPLLVAPGDDLAQLSWALAKAQHTDLALMDAIATRVATLCCATLPMDEQGVWRCARTCANATVCVCSCVSMCGCVGVRVSTRVCVCVRVWVCMY